MCDPLFPPPHEQPVTARTRMLWFLQDVASAVALLAFAAAIGAGSVLLIGGAP